MSGTLFGGQVTRISFRVVKFMVTSSSSVVSIGVVIGMLLAYFSKNSIGEGAIFGARLGLLITILGTVRTRRPTFGGESGIG